MNTGQEIESSCQITGSIDVGNKMPVATQKSNGSWCVVGGGMLGLTLALRLSKQGQDVTVMETASEIGGLASAWDFHGVTWDRHYHVICASDSILRGVLAEIGLEDQIRWVETRTGFYSEGKLYSMSNSMEFLKFPPLGMIEKFRLGLTIYCASKMKNWRKLEQVSVTSWLKKWSGKGTFEKIWEPLLRAKLGDNYKKASASFIWATIQRMYKARRTGLKKEMFGYIPGGYQVILDRFAEHLKKQGVRFQLNARVSSVEKPSAKSEDTTATTVVNNGKREHFDHVVLTTPTHVTAGLLPQLCKVEKQKHEEVEYQGIVCTSVLLRKSLSPYYVTNITDTWVPLTGIIEMTRIVDREQFDGMHLVYLPKYVPSNDPWLNKSETEIEKCFGETLFKMYPTLRPKDIVAMRTSKVRNVMAVPTINYSQKLPPMKTSLDNVYAINSAHILKGILNVNETMEIAEDAMRDVLQPVVDSYSSAKTKS